MKIIKTLFGAALLVVLAGLENGIGAERVSNVDINYDLIIAGFSVGTGQIVVDFNGQSYSSHVSAEITGLASLFFQTKISAEGNGTVRGRRVLPNRYHLDIKDSRAYQLVEMGMNEGDVESLVLDPPIKPKADRVPVLAEHRRNIVDPVGGLILPRRTRQPFDPENCNQTLPVFDGAGRFDLVMQQGRAGKVTVEGYSGHVLVCSIRYKPISGHRRNQTDDKTLEESRSIEVKLAPIAGRPYYIPLEISVPVGPGLFKLVARSASGLAASTSADGDFPAEE